MTKRCKNCGWPNNDTNVHCEKCSAPLEPGQSSRPEWQQTVTESSSDNLRRTVSESQFLEGAESPSHGEAEVQGGQVTNCPSCGYPVRGGISVCPDCGARLDASGIASEVEATKEQAARGGTVNPWMLPKESACCTLKPVAWTGENIEHSPLSFSGETIILNRANTDPNNLSITKKEQAELTFENGEWYIADKSAQHTTYVLASNKIKLHKGDIIVLGNRLFEFN